MSPDGLFLLNVQFMWYIFFKTAVSCFWFIFACYLWSLLVTLLFRRDRINKCSFVSNNPMKVAMLFSCMNNTANSVDRLIRNHTYGKIDQSCNDLLFKRSNLNEFARMSLLTFCFILSTLLFQLLYSISFKTNMSACCQITFDLGIDSH